MGCEEVQRLLDERAVACRGEVGRLRVEAGRLAELIEVREAELVRLDTARQVVGELPATHAAAVSVPAPRASANPGAEAAAAAAAVRVRRTSAFTQEVRLAVQSLAEGGVTSVRCQDVVAALGQEITHREVERARHHLKRLVTAGVVVQLKPGVFTLAGGRDATQG